MKAWIIKHVRLAFTQSEYNALIKKKGERTWKDFVLTLLK